MNINPNVQWWRVVAAAGLFGLAAMFITDQFFTGAAEVVFILVLVLLGLSFMWAFYARDIFWAVAPGVGLLAFALAGLLSLFIPENNGWVAMLILGAAAFVMGAIPNPRGEMKVAYLVGAMILVIGFLMAPLALPLKIVLCLATVLLTGYLMWRNKEALQQA